MILRSNSQSPYIFIYCDTTDLYYTWKLKKGKCCLSIMYVLHWQYLELIQIAYKQNASRRREMAFY